MKKMWKLNNKAVSPVIATILMVAITVVLAAVLYVMVMGFGGDGGNETPSGSFTSAAKVGVTEKVDFGQITPSSNITEFKFIISDGTNSVTVYMGSTYNTWTGVGSPISDIEYVDQAGDSTISAGDHLIITPIATSGAFTLTMIFTATGDEVDSINFTF
jgi:flagellin-like protein